MSASEQIDQYIAKLTDWRGKMVAQLRQLVLETDPGITEEWKWNSPVWSHGKPLCSASAFKTHVGMNFFQGAFLDDPRALFNSGLESKKSRTVKFMEGDAVDEEALKELVRAAIDFNTTTQAHT
jgi:hypothetical protein